MAAMRLAKPNPCGLSNSIPEKFVRNASRNSCHNARQVHSVQRGVFAWPVRPRSHLKAQMYGSVLRCLAASEQAGGLEYVPNIEARLRDVFSPDSLSVSLEDGKLSVRVVSPQFEGKTGRGREALVYKALAEQLEGGKNEVSITPLTPRESAALLKKWC